MTVKTVKCKPSFRISKFWIRIASQNTPLCDIANKKFYWYVFFITLSQITGADYYNIFLWELPEMGSWYAAWDKNHQRWLYKHNHLLLHIIWFNSRPYIIIKPQQDQYVWSGLAIIRAWNGVTEIVEMLLSLCSAMCVRFTSKGWAKGTPTASLFVIPCMALCGSLGSASSFSQE